MVPYRTTSLSIWYTSPLHPQQSGKGNSDSCIAHVPSLMSHPIDNHCPQAVSSPAPTHPLLLPLLVGCCTFVHNLLSSLHAIVGLLTFSLLAVFADNCQPLPSGGLSTSRCLPYSVPIISWLLHSCLPLLPAFVIARHCANVNPFIANLFCHQLSTAALRQSCHQPLPAFASPFLLVGCYIVKRPQQEIQLINVL